VTILLGLLAALSWGVQGIFLKLATAKTTTLTTMISGYVMGLLFLTPFIVPSLPQLGRMNGTFIFWFVLMLAINMTATFSYYRAVQVGQVSLVVPIVASYSGVTVVLSLLTGDRLSALQLLTLFATVCGIAIASTPANALTPATTSTPEAKEQQTSKRAKGLGWALTASLCYALVFWIIGTQLRDSMNGQLLSWLSFIVQFAIIGPIVFIKERQALFKNLGILALSGGTGALGYILTNVGLGVETSVVAVLSSLSSVVSVVLAWVFLRERLARHQWLGVWLALAGVILVSVIK
jgi:drug/metabolite transporter (DMT)-like permease